MEGTVLEWRAAENAVRTRLIAGEHVSTEEINSIMAPGYITKEPRVSDQPLLDNMVRSRLTPPFQIRAHDDVIKSITEYFGADFNWDNVLLYGSFLLASHIPSFEAQDIDLAIYGLSPDAARARIRELVNWFATHEKQAVYIRGRYGIVLIGETSRIIQIYLGVFYSPIHLALLSDYDCCKMCYTGGQLYITKSARASILNQYITVDGSEISLFPVALPLRLYKYHQRGFAVHVIAPRPSLTSSSPDLIGRCAVIANVPPEYPNDRPVTEDLAIKIEADQESDNYAAWHSLVDALRLTTAQRELANFVMYKRAEEIYVLPIDKIRKKGYAVITPRYPLACLFDRDLYAKWEPKYSDLCPTFRTFSPYEIMREMKKDESFIFDPIH